MSTILIVADQSADREYLVTLLGSAGHRPLEAGDFQEALEVVKVDRPDLVIIDVLTPSRESVALVRQLRADPGLAGLPVVVYFANDHPEARLGLTQAGGVHYLSKPAGPEVILRTAKEALGRGPKAPCPEGDGADRDYLRSLTDKLARKVDELEWELAERRRVEAELKKTRDELESRVHGRTVELSGANAELQTKVVEHRRVEEELRRRTFELEAANHDLEAFSYSVSHDLRSPLRAIDGFSRILLEEHAPQLPDEAREYLQLVRDNTRQMGRLVDDLLQFARVGRHPIRKQVVEPAALVQESLDELCGECEGRRVEFVVGDLPPCEAEPALLKQVWINLLSNALKYTRGRDVATIEVGCRADGGPPGEPTYSVKDNGVGFEMRYAHNLFGVFQRLHRAEDYEGTGVGLAIVQRIILRHGGRVWADARPDRGATFSFTLGETVAHE